MFVAVHLTFLPQHFGARVHPSGSWGYWVEDSIGWQKIATLGACLSALSLLLFFYAILEAYLRRRPALANPWGRGATGLEWQFAFPPQVQKSNIAVSVRISS